MRVTGRLTERDLSVNTHSTIHTCPLDQGGAEIPDNKLEFYEWLNHNGISRKAYRCLTNTLQNYVMSRYERYIEGMVPEVLITAEPDRDFRGWLRLAPRYYSLDTFNELSKHEQEALLLEYVEM